MIAQTRGVDDLIDCLRELKGESIRMASAAAKAGIAANAKQMARHTETARDCAVQMRKLKHRAHCLAVELGIADMREDSHYRSTTAPAGFGREFQLVRPRPEYQGDRT